MTVGTTPGTDRPASANGSPDDLCVNTIRTLAMDAVQAANSGHPGHADGAGAGRLHALAAFLRFDPDDPIWPNRDRFVLSAGHASTLLYALLHLAGVKAVNPAYERLGELSVPLEDLKRFRQLDSRCPGHPEYRWTSGVETTTGPLGQGVATSVGMAIAARVAGGVLQPARLRAVRLRRLRAVRRRRPDGGDLGRGRVARRAPEARRTCAGSTTTTASRSRATRRSPSPRTSPRGSSGYGWNVTRVGDANDREMLARAFETFQPGDRAARRSSSSTATSPTARRASRTPARRTASRWARRRSALTKRAYGWPEDAQFLVPDGVREHFAAGIGARGRELREAWMARFEAYRERAPRAGRPPAAHAAPRAARRLGPRHPGVPGRREGARRPRRLGQGPQRDRQERAVARSAARPTWRRPRRRA